MDIVANGQKIPFTITQEKSLTDILKTLLLLTNQADKLVLECKVNGETISLLEREQYKDRQIDGINTIELVVVRKSQRVIDSLQDIEKLFPLFIEYFTEVTNALIAGQKHKAMTKFSETLNVWRQAVNFLRVIETSFKLRFNEIIVNGKSVEQANTDLYNILTEIKTAIEREDLVTISDLIEYELKPHIEEQKAICNHLQSVVQDEAKKLEDDIKQRQ